MAENMSMASDNHCLRCGSRLFKIDYEYIEEYGACSTCVTYAYKCACGRPIFDQRKQLCPACELKEIQEKGRLL